MVRESSNCVTFSFENERVNARIETIEKTDFTWNSVKGKLFVTQRINVQPRQSFCSLSCKSARTHQIEMNAQHDETREPSLQTSAGVTRQEGHQYPGPLHEKAQEEA